MKTQAHRLHGFTLPMLCIGGLLAAHATHAAPKFSKGTSVGGVIAYQDDADPAQFHYLPGQIDLSLGVNLTSFKAQHWGIGPTFWGQDSNGQVYSIVGAILSGSANLGITDAQRQALTDELKRVYGLDAVRLLPVALRNSKVTPILDSQTLAMGGQGVTTSFPSSYVFGTDMVFSIGTGNSLFAQVVGARQAGSEITANPTFGVSIVGDVEFTGDPWRVQVSCDLSQVWKEVRTRVSASVSLGWFRIGSAEYNDIRQQLERSNACTFETREGSLDNATFGRQLFEMMKTIFEAVNTATTEGEGYFKFEPNPHAGDPGGGGAASWLPWSVSINAGRSSASLTQNIRFDREITYTGRLIYSIPASMVLAVSCNTATKRYFVDLGNAGEPCITQQKIDTFNARMRCEAKAKQAKLLDLAERLALGSITQQQYDRLLTLYNRTSLCETLQPLSLAGQQLSLRDRGSHGRSGEVRGWRSQGLDADQLRKLEATVLGEERR